MKKLLMLAVATVTAAFCLSMSAETTYINETSKVGTSKDAWHGTGMYGNKSVTPLGGSSVNLAEHYYSPKNGWSSDKFAPEVGVKPLYQSVSNLPAGTYKVEFYVTAHKANDEGDSFAMDGPSNTVNKAYIKVGDKEAVKEAFTSIVNNGLADNEPILMTFDNVAVAEGESLEMGIEVCEKGKTNWYTIQISSLQRVATDEEALATEIATMNGYKETLNALVAKYPYASSTTLGALQSLIAKTENVDTTSLEAVSALNTEIAAYLNNASNERKLAEEDAVLAGLNATPITIINPDGGASSGSLTDQETSSAVYLDGWYGFRNGTIQNQTSNKTGENPTLSDGSKPAAYFDYYSGGGTDFRVGVQQMVQLEPGEYRLSVLNRAQSGLNYYRLMAVVGHENAANRLPGFTSNDDNEVPGNVVSLRQEGNTGGVFGIGWGISYLDFTVDEQSAPASAPAKEGEATAQKQNVCISVQAGTGSNNAGRWASFTHFQLVKKPKDIGSGISNAVVEDVNAPVEYFDMNGIRVNADNLNKGIYIKRQGNKVTKIIK